MPRPRSSSAAELLLELRRDDDQPLFAQLERELRDAIRQGRLPALSPLPSSRTLAAELGLSRGVVVRAYEDLTAEGYLVTVPGGATAVAREAATRTARLPQEERRRVEFDLRPGTPDLASFPRGAWLRALRRMFTELPSARLGYLDPRGVPELRAELAVYLDRVRGTCAGPAEITVTGGFAQAMRLVAEALHAGGARRIGVEDPSYPGGWTAIRSSGLELVGIPVDEGGIRIDALAAADVDAVVVTPAHQYPTGAVLGPERRGALIRWATGRNATIVEDDYDAEFRYDRQPIGTLQGLSREHVVYIGTASKILAPGLRLGWILAPASLDEAIGEAKRAADLGSPVTEQLALSDLLASGELAHHLRRMRPIYRRRRDVLLQALGRHLPTWSPVGPAAGLHVLAWLPPDVEEERLVRAAAAGGIAIESLGSHRLAPSQRGGIVFGFGNADEPVIERGLERLDTIAAELASTSRAGGGRMSAPWPS